MKKKQRGGFGAAMERFSEAATRWAGSTAAFVSALGLLLAWAFTGPLFHYSDTWQLVINTTTTIVTFLMVFLIQRSQNKDSRAASLKLNELIAALEGASNRLIDAESMSEDDLDILRRHYRKVVALASRDASLGQSHSIEEAESRHAFKAKKR